MKKGTIKSSEPITATVLELVGDCVCMYVCRWKKMFEKILEKIDSKKKLTTPAVIDPSTLDSHQQRKQRRIKAVAKVLESRVKVKYKEFVAELQYNGLRKQVAEEYLEALRDLGKIVITEEHIVWNNQEG